MSRNCNCDPEYSLLSLLREFYTEEHKDIGEAYRGPENMNTLSFFGFYEWLKKREAARLTPHTVQKEQTDASS